MLSFSNPHFIDFLLSRINTQHLILNNLMYKEKILRSSHFHLIKIQVFFFKKGISFTHFLLKVGPIMFVNHGIGCPSLSVVLNEVVKLIHYAGCKDVTFFRVGTCGGLGVRPGTLVITEEAVDGLLRPEYRQVKLPTRSVSV